MINQIKKIVMVGFSIIFLSSITLNALLYRELRKYYTQLYAVELDPLGFSHFQDETVPQTNSKSTLVFFGDSRAAQWFAPQLENYTFINRGIGNQTSTQVLLRFEEHIQPLKPDILVIQVCINDLKTIPLFPERKQQIIATCEENIELLVQKTLDLDATVILTTIFPTSGHIPPARTLVWSNDIYEAIKEVNRYILSLKNEEVIIFDTASILSDPKGNIKLEYVYDLLHLNDEGYEVLNVELVQILEYPK